MMVRSHYHTISYHINQEEKGDDDDDDDDIGMILVWYGNRNGWWLVVGS